MCFSHLEGVLVAAGDGNVTAYDLNTLNPGQLNTAFLNRFFLNTEHRISMSVGAHITMITITIMYTYSFEDVTIILHISSQV